MASQIYTHYKDVPESEWHWPNFSPGEMACPHCGELALVPSFMNWLQSVRWEYGKPISVASAYRCPIHNEAVGGGKDSSHTRGLALDPLRPASGVDLAKLEDAFNRHGWQGHGSGANKMHYDQDKSLGHRAWMYGE